MFYFPSRPLATLLPVFLCLVATGAPCSADVPVFSDSFRPTAPDHTPGSPVDGAKLERGHGRWQSTPGLFFDDGKVKGGGAEEYARFSFVPENHSRSARVYFEASVDPGSNGWSGVGFTNGEDGPLSSVGQIWMKIDDRGRVEVRGDGASNQLFKDSQQNPAYVAGMNKIRLEYNRRTNAARAWLNGIELPLGPLDMHGFVPDIHKVAFQLRDNDGGLKTKVIGDSGIGGIVTGIVGAVLGDQFSTILRLGVDQGDPLGGVLSQIGSEYWSATPSVGFGQEYATNIDLGAAVATLPFNPGDYPGYAESSVEAIINPADATWVGIGFGKSPAGALFTHGEIWALLRTTGQLQIFAKGTTHVLFNDLVVDPGVLTGGIPVKLTFNRIDGTARVDLGELNQGIPPTIVVVPQAILPLEISDGGFHAFRAGGFTATNQFAVDDFAIRVSQEIPPLDITTQPVGQTQVYGGQSEFHCAAQGGVPPYGYRWQATNLEFGLKDFDPSGSNWVDIDAETLGVSGADTPDLVIYPVSTEHRSLYRCVAVDSNVIPSEAPSNSVSLTVLEPIIADSFSTGGASGRVSGTPINGLFTEHGGAVWSANSGALLGEDFLTNGAAGADILAEIPVTQSMTSTFKVLSTSANVLVGDSDWIGVGFSTDDLVNFFVPGTGLLWARVTNNGRVVVLANGEVLFAGYILSPEDVLEPVHVRVEYNTDTDTPSVWINNAELTLNQTEALGPFGAAGINAGRLGGFDGPGMFSIDDFALTGSQEIPFPTFSPSPQSQSVGLGFDAVLNCGAIGGLPPYEFQWSRAGSVIWTDGRYIVDGDTTSSTLTVTNFDPSLEGAYLCEVLDSRYGDSEPIQAPATILTEFPDLGVMWGGIAGENVFIADAYEYGSQTDRVEYLETDRVHGYNLEVVLKSDPAPNSNVSYPLNIWGACHQPGVEPTLPYSYLGTTSVSGGPGHVWVEIKVPEQCLGGAPWAVLSLFVDVNAEEDPDGSAQFTYPDSIAYARPYIPEMNFGFDNRGSLTGWIPVIDGKELDNEGFDDLMSALIGDADPAVSFELDFKNAGELPPTDGYVADWVDPSVAANQWVDYLRFNLHPWDPCVMIDDAIPTDPSGNDYQPYMAWNTNASFEPYGGITRFRMDNLVGRRDNALFLGYRNGEPTPPTLDLNPAESGDPAIVEHAVVLGPGGPDNEDSKNYLGWANQRQYHVLVWENGLGIDYPLDSDGRAELEQPDFPDGSPTGTETWVYLGFVKDGLTTWGNSIPCSEFDFEWYFVDAIRFWGAGEIVNPETVDQRALHFATESAPGVWTPLAGVVAEGTEERVCLVAETTSTNGPPPLPDVPEIRFWKEKVDGTIVDDSTFGTERLTGSDPGITIHCPLGDDWEFDYCGEGCVHWIRGRITDHPDDPNPTNNEKTTSVDISSGCPAPTAILP